MEIFKSIVFVCALLTLVKGEDQSLKGEKCLRDCGGEAMVCEFDFTVEWYHVLSKACYGCPTNVSDCYRPACVAADGTDKPIITINRQLPGPSIQVCINDTIRVRVHNHMANSEGVSIHWHGLHQRGSPHMDGVGSLTQCDIHRHGQFQYDFLATNAGTHFYHGHSGRHRADGLFGALIIREPPSPDPVARLYDRDLPEHVIVLSDWMNELTLAKFTDHHHDDGDNKPRSMIINGRGVFQSYKDDTGMEHYTPRALFTVEPNKKYLFRLISNGVLNCPIEMSIDDHKLTVIASDGAKFEPIVRDRLIIYAGERYDVVVDTSQTPGLYWVKFAGLADCAVPIARARQQALLTYSNAAVNEDDIQQRVTSPPLSYEESTNQGTLLNPLNTESSDTALAVVELNSTDEDDTSLLQERADYTHYLASDFYKIDNIFFHHPQFYPIQAVPRGRHLYMPQINGVSMMLPSVPLLTQFSDLSPTDLVNLCEGEEMTTRNCSYEFCHCIHYLKFPLNKVVDIVLIDEGVTFDASHPFHLHGHYFRVVGMAKLGSSTSREEVQRMDEQGRGLPRKLVRAVKKDTVVVPDGGYTIIRFYTDNPGFWLLHCHIDFHVEIGMGLVIQVGEIADMPSRPTGFPTCHNWPSTSTTTLSSSQQVIPTPLLISTLTFLLPIYIKLVV